MKQAYNRNLIIGFTFSMALLVISSAASLFSIFGLLKSAGWVSHTHAVIARLDGTLLVLKDAETSQRGYLLTGDDRFLAPFISAPEKTVYYLNQLKNFTADNHAQQVSCDQLRLIALRRIQMMNHVLELKKSNGFVDIPELQTGREYMEQVRSIINGMKAREEQLLEQRTANMSRFSAFTPIIIILAALLAIIITIIFYLRVRNDFRSRTRLQAALQEKDADITRRIAIIQALADKIAAGDYSVQATDEGSDGLGSLSESINKMAAALRYSFGKLSDREWLQAGIARLNEQMLGVSDLNLLTRQVITFVAEYSGSQVGALYLNEGNQRLLLASGYALSTGPGKRIKWGTGIAGQCARDARTVSVSGIPEGALIISYAAGELRPSSLMALPLIFEDEVTGVMELGTVGDYSERACAFLTEASAMIGTAIVTVRSRTRMQELLEETQAQSEELQAQHSELENINTELEAQALKLQASEEELRVQQEELLQANQELEERTHLLEERNETIEERNGEIQKKADELALSTKYKSEFLANMSHELRTPLNSILLLSRLMYENNENNLSEEQVEYARVIRSSGNGLLSLIDEILDLSKIEAGKMELEYAETAVADIAGEMKSLFSPLAKDKHLGFDIRVAADVPPVIETDRQRLEQILKNLFSNAFKFTRTGSVTMQVSLSAADAGMIRFAVRDTGIGIAPAKQQLIFEAFQQADGSTRRKYGGTGLGLSISRELVRLMGGTLGLESREGEGAEFIVSVPVRKQEALPVPEVPAEPEPAAPVTDPGAQTPEPLPKFIMEELPAQIPDDREELQPVDKVILIVEDDTAFARSLLDFTRKRGYKGIVAVQGKEGLQLAHQYRPVAILLDIQLPVMNGWEVMQALKSAPDTRHIPVHIMSSLEMKKESLQQGAVDFINKPVAYEQMGDIFKKLEHVLHKEHKKVLIIEDNPKHAAALAHFLGTFEIHSEIAGSIEQGVSLLKQGELECVILDMGIPDKKAYEMLESVKKYPGLEGLPIIIFTGKSLSKAEEQRIRQYADSIVVKTAHSYKRMIDEVSLFLHLMEENLKAAKAPGKYRKLGALDEVLKEKTILIADDDVRNIFSLTKALEQHKINVLSATDGDEALRLLKENPGVDLVLMDMMMPEKDGYETTATIRKQPETRHLPVIAVTAKAMNGDRERCIQAGASDYISKPVDIDQLISLLRVWLYDKAV